MTEPAPPVRVAVADGHRVVAEALAERLDREPGLVVVGVATDVAGLGAVVSRACPQVVLSEPNLGGGSVFGVAERPCETRFVLLSATVVDALVARAIQAGAGYLLRSEPLSAVIAGIRRAAAGDVPLSEQVARRLKIDPVTGRHVLKPDSHLTGLTARQIEVLRLLARGRTVRAVARDLGLSEKGVESHRYRIMNRLGIRDRVGLARYAIREGVIPP